MKSLRLSLLAILILAPTTPAVSAQERDPQNLQVLSDLSRQELIDVMLRALRGLGLPRRANRGCLHCHVGSLDQPRDTWDWASDAKPAKRKARVMMAMTREINEGFLARLPEHSSETHEVTCYTCHAGRVNPQPLPELLLSEFEEGGFSRLAEAYREARGRHFAADAYDFRVGTLIGVGNELARRGEFEAAASVHELNIEFHDEPAAHGGLIRSRMVEALEGGGIDAMIARYQRLRGDRSGEALQPSALDSLGWELFRSGDQAAGMAVFELNHAEHPDAFAPNESLAWAALSSGDPDRAVEIAERWLRDHPDHELGETLLRQLMERR